MKTLTRYLNLNITKDLRKKMVFLGGARQSGKTILAEQIMRSYRYRVKRKGLYLNWDYDEDRRRILKKVWGDKDQLIILDELHKFPRWKNWLKGIYDVSKTKHSFFVTGSARLNVYRRGGDSLLGRYHYWRLHPFTLSEPVPKITPSETLSRLLRTGGFPEPFLDGNEREAKRWRRERLNQVLREDIRDLEPIQHLQTLGLFVDALRERVGSLTVLSNIARDLQVSPKTLARWLVILENMYVIFVVRPLTKKLPRAIQKAPKVYFFDNGDVLGDEGSRFENLVASHLLKKIHYLEDSRGDRYELRYIRDKEGREVDFVVLKEGQIQEMIEVKWSDTGIHRPLQYYSERLKPKRAFQIVARCKRPYNQGKLSVESPFESLSQPLV